MDQQNLYLNTTAIDAVNEGKNIPTYLRDYYNNRAFKLKYVSTDGWRGYHDVIAVKKYGWKKIDYEGWVTGDWDDAPADSKGSNVEAKMLALAKDYDKKGFDVTAVFTPTSNVFSTSFDVFIKAK